MYEREHDIHVDNNNEANEKKSKTIVIYIALENDPYWDEPEVIDVATNEDSATNGAYMKASIVFDDCQGGDHHPLLIRDETTGGYMVIDELDDIHRSFYVVEREIQI